MRKLVVIIILVTQSISLNAQEKISKTGQFSISSTVFEILGGKSAQNFKRIIPEDKTIEWSVYVPENYDSAVPTGVLVFISAGNSGKIPDAWKELMEQYKLIWIGANKSGNKTATSLRVAYAVLALALINKNYKVDADRIYLSGFSGGGRVSSMVATEYAHIFRGAIFNSGANFWGKDKPKRYDDMKKNHYVFVAGSKDFNLQDTRRVYSAYRKAGLQNTKLIVIPMMSHRIPRKSHFEKAINFLDARKIH